MKSVYEASSTLDAHMVLNLLEQEGVQGRVDGEYLPGGVGELQAINLVRVMVDEADYERAARIIIDWEAIQPEGGDKAGHKTSSGLSIFMLGAVIGAGLIYWAYNTPVTEEVMDVNGDGLPDNESIYKGNRISSTEADRNLDGDMDVIYSYDRRGILKGSRHDDNFDGVFETEITYVNGLPVNRSSDHNQDGKIDYSSKYTYGNIDEVMIFGQGRDLRKKRQKYHMGKLQSAEYDTNGDGYYDVEYEYDYFEEIKSKVRPAQ